jgi:two-component system NtrC family sensor kinase
MRKIIVIIFILFSVSAEIFSQDPSISNLVREINTVQNDTLKLVWLRNLSRIYAELNPDSAYHYSELAMELSGKMGLKLDEGAAMREMGYALLNKGNYARSLQTVLSALAILEKPEIEKRVLTGHFPYDNILNIRTAHPHAQRLSQIAFTHQILGILYANSGNMLKSRDHHMLAKKYAQESENIPLQSITYLTLNRVYLNLKKTDSALFVIKKAYELMLASGFKTYLGSAQLNIGRTYAAMGKRDSALAYYRLSVLSGKEYGYWRGVAAGNLAIADFFKMSGNSDSVLHYTRMALEAAYSLNAPDLFLRSYRAFADYYKTVHNSDSAVKYQSLIIKINDSLFSVKQAQEFQNIDFDEQQRKQQIEAAKAEYRSKIQIYLLLGGLGFFLLIAVLLWRNSSQRKKANTLLSQQKKELESTLSRLKATQNQLIQSEKMASLGEMTAGIAHEIQNPLNFVNNFSELNAELAIEMQQELVNGNMDAAIEIARNIKENEEKINHHGKRADSIVKSMLQHSRSGSGKKESTDINKLVDECLRLSYHGLRAKDKSFEAKFETDFDQALPKIEVVPEDIGRVILNLINNAFYSGNEKKKLMPGNFEPVVIVSTKRSDNKAEIKIKDNGNGIPESIRDKIFQPFFTTKPTGQGTGLGLSMSYDIITKGHQGELKVNSREGEYAEFVIILPINT